MDGFAQASKGPDHGRGRARLRDAIQEGDFMKFPLFPEQASTTAAQVDHLYFFLTAVSAFFVTIIFVPMVWFLFKYRRGHKADRSPLRVSTMKIEVTWTVIPLLLAMGM